MVPQSETKRGCEKNRIWCCVRIGTFATIWLVLLGYMVIRNLQEPFYAVIIDAGSTASRVHVFTFHKSILDANMILDSESFANLKPGLSWYADDPVRGAESLQVLLDKAKATIPKSKWKSTPISLKATAGLRFLPKNKSDKLLNECRKFVEKSGFLLSEESISVMDGTDEGIFSWFTVNFLLGRFTAQSHKNTVAVLDLGGGSTQVTFSTDGWEDVENQKEHIFTMSTVTKNTSVYSQSYLGMGYEAARKGILTYGQNVDQKNGNDSQPSVVSLHSACVDPTISFEWPYRGVNYLVKGLTNETTRVAAAQNLTRTKRHHLTLRFSECLRVAKNYVGTIINKPLGLKNQSIVALGFHSALDRESGEIVTVDDYLQQAMIQCEHPNIDQPFRCLDLTYNHVLLRDGFDLEATNELQLYRTIDNYKLSWALGAAFHIFQN